MNVIAYGFGAGSQDADKTYVLPDSADGQIHISDANLIFSGEYSRSGPDLHIVGSEGQHLVVPGYFAGEGHASVISPEGAVLTGDIRPPRWPDVAGEYAGQIAPTPAPRSAVSSR